MLYVGDTWIVDDGKAIDYAKIAITKIGLVLKIVKGPQD